MSSVKRTILDAPMREMFELARHLRKHPAIDGDAMAGDLIEHLYVWAEGIELDDTPETDKTSAAPVEVSNTTAEPEDAPRVAVVPDVEPENATDQDEVEAAARKARRERKRAEREAQRFMEQAQDGATEDAGAQKADAAKKG